MYSRYIRVMGKAITKSTHCPKDRIYNGMTFGRELKNKESKIMKNKEIRNSFLVATTGVSIIQKSYLKEYNPEIKLLLGLLPGMFLRRSIKPNVKYWGDSLIAGSIIGYTINKLTKSVCDYSYTKNLPQNNSLLVNINTGKVIENIGNPHFIFVTKIIVQKKVGRAVHHFCIALKN